MSDANLLAFGCGVSFLVLGGVYGTLREAFARRAAVAIEHNEAENRRTLYPTTDRDA